MVLPPDKGLKSMALLAFCTLGTNVTVLTALRNLPVEKKLSTAPATATILQAFLRKSAENPSGPGASLPFREEHCRCLPC
jgi:hypothetical protein